MSAASKRKRLKSMMRTATGKSHKKIPKSYYLFGCMCFSLILLTYKFQLIGIFSADTTTVTLTEFGSIFSSAAYDLYCDRKWPNSSRPCLCYVDYSGPVNASTIDMKSIKCAMTFEPAGRLGNVIGQYVGLMVLARFNDRPALMTPEMSQSLAKYFRHLSIPALNSQVYARNKWTEVELDYVMQPAYKNLSGLFLKLRGYPYSKTYFRNFIEDIRREFRLKMEYETRAQNTLHKIKNSRKFRSADTNSRSSNSTDLKSSNSVFKISGFTDLKSSNSTSEISSSSKADLNPQGFISADPNSSSSAVTFVGVHVRRGDYLKIFNSSHRGVLADRRYFLRAMSYFRQRYAHPLFVIVSNDMKWCEENIPNDAHDVYFAGTGNENDPITDFALLVNCNHTIYTFGTYGFFAALFAGGDVVYFTNFTDNLRNDSFYHYDTPLPQWHPIAADRTQLPRNNSTLRNLNATN